MKLLSERTGIKWLKSDSKLSLFETKEYSFDKSLITSVFCFIIYEDKVCYVYNKKDNRGNYEVPGGHVDPGESPEEAVKRECVEEAMVEITSPKLIGVHKIDNKESDGKYPIIGYQAFYIAYAKSVSRFEENEEISLRSFFDIDEAEKLPWSQYYSDLFQLFKRTYKK